MNNLSYQTSLTNIVLIHQIEWMVSNIQYFWYQIKTIIIIFIGIKCISIILKFNNEIDEAETGEVEVDDITWISSWDIVKLQLMFDKDNIKKEISLDFDWLQSLFWSVLKLINKQWLASFLYFLIHNFLKF
jgi:hypothetical protein